MSVRLLHSLKKQVHTKLHGIDAHFLGNIVHMKALLFFNQSTTQRYEAWRILTCGPASLKISVMLSSRQTRRAAARKCWNDKKVKDRNRNDWY